MSGGALRTVLAFLFAPATAVVGVAMVGATFRTVGVGPTWFEAFGQIAVASSFACYAASYVFGTPFVFLLRAKRRESPRDYAVVGSIAGLVFFVVILIIGIWPDSIWDAIVSSLVGALGCAVLGAVVALSFAGISGARKRGVANSSGS